MKGFVFVLILGGFLIDSNLSQDDRGYSSGSSSSVTREFQFPKSLLSGGGFFYGSQAPVRVQQRIVVPDRLVVRDRRQNVNSPNVVEVVVFSDPQGGGEISSEDVRRLIDGTFGMIVPSSQQEIIVTGDGPQVVSQQPASRPDDRAGSQVVFQQPASRPDDRAGSQVVFQQPALRPDDRAGPQVVFQQPALGPDDRAGAQAMFQQSASRPDDRVRSVQQIRLMPQQQPIIEHQYLRPNEPSRPVHFVYHPLRQGPENPGQISQQQARPTSAVEIPYQAVNQVSPPALQISHVSSHEVNKPAGQNPVRIQQNFPATSSSAGDEFVYLKSGVSCQNPALGCLKPLAADTRQNQTHQSLQKDNSAAKSGIINLIAPSGESKESHVVHIMKKPCEICCKDGEPEPCVTCCGTTPLLNANTLKTAVG